MSKKKVVVAFSGGLDTSYNVMYLTKEMGYEVYAACANTGGFSAEQLKANEENAYKLGAVKYVTLDVTQEYYEKSLRYMVYGNVLRNNCYPISVSSERIFQAIAIARYAKEIGADAIAHGSTGAGNDQIRFDMTFLVMAPGVEIITLTRDRNLSRQEEVDYLNANGYFADFTKLKYSYNVGIWGTSICGGEILDSKQGLPESAYLKHVTKEGTEELKLGFEKGEICSVNGVKYDDKIKDIQEVEKIGADAIAHGSTGAGNDQIRFDMTFLVKAPGVEIITLTRDRNLSRKEEIDYLNANGFYADFTKLKYSYNVGIWGTSICGGEILDSKQGLPESAYLKHPTKDGSEILALGFEKGELVSVNGVKYEDKIKAIQAVEEIGASYAIGRDCHVGDTIIGIKGRVGFEAAAPMLIIAAHRFLEKYTLSKWQQYWKDQVSNWYGMFLHESQYLEPVMPDMEAMLESSQRNVNGEVTLELRPYSFQTVGCDTPDDLVHNKLGEYGEGAKAWTADDAKGFIKITSTPLRAYYSVHPDEER